MCIRDSFWFCTEIIISIIVFTILCIVVFTIICQWFQSDRRSSVSKWRQRKTLTNPTFGGVNLLFFRKSTTRAFYLMDFSSNSLRSVQMWRIWLAHNLIEQFWKILKSLLAIGLMRLRGDGLYTGLLIKIMAYLFVTSVQNQPGFRHLSVTQIMRQLRRESNLLPLLSEHFHLEFLGIPAIS